MLLFYQTLPKNYQVAKRARCMALATLSILTTACQTAPPKVPAGISDGGEKGAKESKASPAVRRDALAVSRVYIEPSVLKVDASPQIAETDRAMVRWEIDRQLCFKLSQRFEITTTPEPNAGRVRTTIAHIGPTSRGGSAAAAAASLFIPLPVRYGGGGLTAESELITSGGQQAAVVSWNKSVKGVSRVAPSLSRVGDALQLADRFAKAVGKGFVDKDSHKHAVGKPDPCERFGPRRAAGRMVGGALLSLGTGLYAPSVVGAGRAPKGEISASNP